MSLLSIESMYGGVKSTVVIENGKKRSDYCFCYFCVLQGSTLSPLLFSIFIKELHEYMSSSLQEGSFVTEEMLNLISLLFVDDPIVVAHAPCKETRSGAYIHSNVRVEINMNIYHKMGLKMVVA